MYFLLNDVVLDLDLADVTSDEAAERYGRLSLDFVASLGAELFADEPRLQATDPERARRLATMIAAVAPDVNAAIFVAPTWGCDPQAVHASFETVPPSVMADLIVRQDAGALSTLVVDNQIWRRLAA
jgi:hypothetical protein